MTTLPLKCVFYLICLQLFFEIAIKVFDYNEEWSQNMLFDFPVTYAFPFAEEGFRSFSTSRGSVMGKMEGAMER